MLCAWEEEAQAAVIITDCGITLLTQYGLMFDWEVVILRFNCKYSSQLSRELCFGLVMLMAKYTNLIG